MNESLSVSTATISTAPNIGVVEIPGPQDALPRKQVCAHAPAGATEILPFTVRVVNDEEDMAKAVTVRHAAYARHVPEFAEKLRLPEYTDSEMGVTVLLAESKLDGSPLGTMRIQTNQFRPLSLEQSVELPEWLREGSLAEATRLGIAGERVGSMVKIVLFKALFQYCRGSGIDHLVIAARAPIDRQYAGLLFEDVYTDGRFVPLRHANNMPHRVLCFNLHTAEERWSKAKHPLLNFMCNTHHPDIVLTNRMPVPVANRHSAEIVH